MDRKKFLELVKKEENFRVTEIPKKKFLSKYERSRGGIKDVQGPYTIFILQKRGLTTEQAVRIVSSRLRVPTSEIGFAGLKDKFALTEQYISVKGYHEGFREENISLRPAGKSSRPIAVGDLEGNAFWILIGKKTVLKKIFSMPNYFGFQRFGSRGENAKIGLLLLKREYAAAIEMINNSCETRFPFLKSVPKKRLKFFVQSYQSQMFNLAVRSMKSAGRKKMIRVPGYNMKASPEISGLMKKDSIKEKDFEFPDLRFRCDGYERPASVEVKNLSIKTTEHGTEISFALPPGSYASSALEAMGL